MRCKTDFPAKTLLPMCPFGNVMGTLQGHVPDTGVEKIYSAPSFLPNSPTFPLPPNKMSVAI